MGDEAFFASLNAGRRRRRLGQRSAAAWDAASVRAGACRAARATRSARGSSATSSDRFFPCLQRRRRRTDEAYVSLDDRAVDHQQARPGARLRRRHPVPRRADPLAGQPRRRPRLRQREGQKLAKLVEAQTRRPADPDHQLRRPPARPARAGRRARHRRGAARLRRRAQVVGGPLPHHHAGGPQPAGHRREARAQAEVESRARQSWTRRSRDRRRFARR